MDLATVIPIILGSSVVSAFTTQIVLWWQKKNEASKSAKFSALNLSHQLEDYAFACMELVSDDSLYRQSQGAVGNRASIPEFAIPKDDFSKFSIPLVDQLFSLPKEVKLARSEVSFVCSVGDDDEAHDLIVHHIQKLGIKSIELSESVRSSLNLPARTATYGSGTLLNALRDYRATAR